MEDPSVSRQGGSDPIGLSSTWATSYLRLSSADFITIIAESNFRYRQVMEPFPSKDARPPCEIPPQRTFGKSPEPPQIRLQERWRDNRGKKAAHEVIPPDAVSVVRRQIICDYYLHSQYHTEVPE